jgi:hypothetical protein
MHFWTKEDWATFWAFFAYSSGHPGRVRSASGSKTQKSFFDHFSSTQPVLSGTVWPDDLKKNAQNVAYLVHTYMIKSMINFSVIKVPMLPFFKANTLYPGGTRSEDPTAPVSSVAGGDDTTM